MGKCNLNETVNTIVKQISLCAVQLSLFRQKQLQKIDFIWYCGIFDYNLETYFEPKTERMKKILMFVLLLLFTGSLVMGQTVQLSGTVTSSDDGLPIPGITVLVKGTTLGALTGPDGKYVLLVPEKTQSLVFSFIGFRTQEVPVAGKTTIDLKLEQDLFKVDEVVVVAYGTQQKRDVTGTVATVKVRCYQECTGAEF